MSLQDQIPPSLQQFSEKLAALNQQSHQQRIVEIASISNPKPVHMGSINLDGLIPDISLELDHIIALLQAAYEQIEPSRPTPRQTDVAAWLLSDAMREARGIYQRLYETKPPEEDV